MRKSSLHRKHKGVLKDDIKLQLMLPEKLRNIVIYMAHASQMPTHWDVRKIKASISAFFYWPSMLDGVKRHVKVCDLCSVERDFCPFELIKKSTAYNAIEILKELLTIEQKKKKKQKTNVSPRWRYKRKPETCEIAEEEKKKPQTKDEQYGDQSAARYGSTKIRLRTFRLRHFVYRHFVYRHFVYYCIPAYMTAIHPTYVSAHHYFHQFQLLLTL